ncbi:hypothetical protein [Enterococcus casseliflavus]|uniref:hypothetical protein n=1 Tax=Enterococcus casseliflavus TaxID=37734 RepID=UPI00301B4E38
MGLDITAYKNLKRVNNPERDEYGDLVEWKSLVDINKELLDYTELHFEGRTQGLEAGVYSYESEYDFRAGSYGNYNRFRDRLEQIASNSQLHELIVFSDCEGFIGSVVSKKLAKDFLDLEQIAKENLDRIDFGTYLNFKEAFELASENGCVSFY